MIEFVNRPTVELIKHNASDIDVARAAWVSNFGSDAREKDSDRVAGLINFLYRERHMCYDEDTEVLTGRGWLPWARVLESDTFATLNTKTDEISFESAAAVVSYDVSEELVRINTKHSDLLVTKNHNMLASRRRQPAQRQWELVPALDFLKSSHNIRMGEGLWNGEGTDFSEDDLRLIGFFIGDGNFSDSSVSFNLRKQRKIDFLHSIVSGYNENTKIVSGLSAKMRNVLKSCYLNKEKIIPFEILSQATTKELTLLLEGLENSDGCRTHNNTLIYSTTSKNLVNQLQELALKIGGAATYRVNLPEGLRDSFGKIVWCKTAYTVTFFQKRNIRPRIGWTTSARKKEVSLIHYEGKVYCATVPNGTLYVRRNGKPCWSGNSPFEHGSFTFFIDCPLFVAREFHRHRTWSYNETSGRYSEMKPRFYMPPSDRPLIQSGKIGNYTFTPGSDDQYAILKREKELSAKEDWDRYQRLMSAGIAKEMSRTELPLSLMTQFYATANPRNVIQFLLLRNDSPAMHEIRDVAIQIEEKFAVAMPLTYNVYQKQREVWSVVQKLLDKYDVETLLKMSEID